MDIWEKTQVAWAWIWTNIQSLEALAAILVIFGIWFKFFRKKPEPQPLPNHQPTHSEPPPTTSQRFPSDLEELYYQSLDETCQLLRLNLVEQSLGKRANEQRISLAAVYQDQRIRLATESEPRREERGQEESLPLMQALAKLPSKRMVLLGKLGSGKTSFVNYLTHRVIQSRTQTSEDLPAFLANRPIVRLLLREVGLHLQESTTSAGLIWQEMRSSVQQQLENYLQKQADPPLAESEFNTFWAHFRQTFTRRQGILLLDGWDEVSRADAVQCLRSAVIAFANEAAHQDILIIVTSRPSAYEREEQRLASFWQAEIEPMNQAQIEAFIQHWYQLIENRDPRQAMQRAGRLVQTIFENPALKERRDLQEMAERPLLLTLLIGLDSAGKSLNNSRPKVYGEIVDLLLQRWQENLKETLPALRPELQSGMQLLAKSPDALLKALQKAAYETYEMLENKEAAGGGLEFPASVVLGNLSVPCEGGEKERHVLDFLQERSTLLMAGSQPDKLQFAHKSIHEYLAARYLLNDAEWEEKITQHLVQNPSWWREVFLFMTKDEADGRYGSAVTFLYNVLLGQYQREDLAQQRLLILASEAALEMDLAHQHDTRTSEHLYYLLQTELVALLPSQALSLLERAEVGRLLGELGDPRQGVAVIKEGAFKGLPDIDWVTIPAGQLRMGSEEEDQEAYNSEKPAHTVLLDAFQISRYPVTNAQYACFMEAGGYQQERYWQLTRRGLAWWQQAEVQAPKYWDRHQWNNPNHPVVGVSWYEALAYCQWLNETPLYQGKLIRLPQEDEWEYAARGEAGWRYAWGQAPDAHLGNYAEADLNQTSSVGLFPAGKAFQAADGSGVHDLSGNFWEWTTSQWGASYELEFTYDKWVEQQAIRNHLDTEQEVSRIVRGGSWNDPTVYLRCAVRSGFHPADRYYDLGFRVCAFSLAADC
ncbi:MAG: SUMF1/EgtB/PvdO family nonheme iron enzyme [Thiolinea sp.]